MWVRRVREGGGGFIFISTGSDASAWSFSSDYASA